MKIGILVFDQVDLLDLGGPYEVFLTASRLALRDGADSPFEVVTVGRTADAVAAFGGLRLIPHCRIADVGALDAFVVPGAVAIDDVVADQALMEALRPLTQRVNVVASVCTGAFILGKLGFLGERRWTTHWEDVDILAARIGGTGERFVRWVDTGDVVASGGLSSGIAMALHLVDRWAGRELAERTARQLEYQWDPAGQERSLSRGGELDDMDATDP